MQVNDYKGLFGSFDGYIFDTYYDWSTYVKPKLDKAIVFNVYFMPPKNGSETDHAKLIELSKKYDISNWSLKPYNFWWREGNIIMKNGVGVFNPSFKKLNKRMQIVVDILKNENLKPVDTITLNNWRKDFPMNNIPEIELYHKEKSTGKPLR